MKAKTYCIALLCCSSFHNSNVFFSQPCFQPEITEQSITHSTDTPTTTTPQTTSVTTTTDQTMTTTTTTTRAPTTEAQPGKNSAMFPPYFKGAIIKTLDFFQIEKIDELANCTRHINCDNLGPKIDFVHGIF